MSVFPDELNLNPVNVYFAPICLVLSLHDVHVTDNWIVEPLVNARDVLFIPTVIATSAKLRRDEHVVNDIRRIINNFDVIFFY